MAEVNKNQAVIDFLLQCPVIASNPLFFNFLNAHDDDKQIITQSDDISTNRKYVDGSVMKRFTFSIIDFRGVIYQPVPKAEGYTDRNVSEMFDVQGIMDWINLKADLGEYPYFGNDCFIDDMKTTSNTPNLNGVDASVSPALAKYSMTIQIDYLDTSKCIWKKEE